jgi:hypothetical protein
LEEANVKKILIIVLAVGLALALSVTSVTFAAGGKKEVALAQDAGQAWLDSTVAVMGEPVEWVGARLTTPQVYYDLKGNPDAYMFAIESNGEVVGYIIIGSSDYGYAMFEAGGVPPLSIPSADQVKSTLKRDLGLDVASIGGPARLLYLGFDNLFAVYEAGGQEVAVDLKFDFAMTVSNLTAIAAMPSPEEYKANMEAAEQAKREELADSISTAQTPSSYSLPMSAYCYYWCADCWLENLCACGPSAGVSIGYYYKYGHTPQYSNLPGITPDQCQMYLELFNTMQTDCSTGFTTIGNYGPGFAQMAANHGYNNFYYASVRWPGSAYYDTTLKNYIYDHHWPIAMCATYFYNDIEGNPNFPPPKSHFVAIKGYQDGYTWNNHVYNRAVICTDSFSMDNSLYLNWDLCGYNRYVCAIMD